MLREGQGASGWDWGGHPRKVALVVPGHKRHVRPCVPPPSPPLAVQKVPLEYKILGYAAEDYPGLTGYTPPLEDQPLLPGAHEEAPPSAATPSGVITPAEALPRMPDSCKQMPYVVHELANRCARCMAEVWNEVKCWASGATRVHAWAALFGVHALQLCVLWQLPFMPCTALLWRQAEAESMTPPSHLLFPPPTSLLPLRTIPHLPTSHLLFSSCFFRYADDKVYATPVPSWGMDVAYSVQPRVYGALHPSWLHEAPSSGSVRALRGAPLLCEQWLPRKESRGLQLAPEFVPPLMQVRGSKEARGGRRRVL